MFNSVDIPTLAITTGRDQNSSVLHSRSMIALSFFLGFATSMAGKYKCNQNPSYLHIYHHFIYPSESYSAQVSIGGECWSSANGVAAGGCTSGTACAPWLPDGGSWDGSSPWYCLAMPKLASGATCDYATKVNDQFKKTKALSIIIIISRMVFATLV